MTEFNDRSDLKRYLATRRSGKPRDLVAPGPDADELRTILSLAGRTPDHGKLFPWRFVVIDDRAAFAALLLDAWRAERGAPGAADRAGIDEFAHQAPALVAVASQPSDARPIPRWEQELSAGAATMNLLHAAHAHGYAAGWLTGWAAASPAVTAALCPGGRLAGFVFIGTPARPLAERPRPDYDLIVSNWP